MLTRLQLENFGCFPRLDLRLGAITVLVGPNDSGKSTILHGLISTRTLAHPVLQSELIPSLTGLVRVKWSGAAPGEPVVIRTAFGEANADIEAVVEHRLDERLGLLGQSVHIPDGRLKVTLGTTGIPAGSVHVEAPRSNKTVSFRVVPQTLFAPQVVGTSEVTDHPALTQVLAEAATVCGSIQRYRFHPRSLRAPSSAATEPEVPYLAEDGAGLPTLLSVLAGAERDRLQHIEDSFVLAVPTLAGFKVLPTPTGGHRLVFRLAYSSDVLEASQVSDGALLFLGFLALLHHPRPPRMILVEEPENGVHPSRLRDIAKLLRRIVDEPGCATQVVVTTHSPYLLDEVPPESAWFCRREPNGAAVARSFADIEGINDRLREYQLGELWTAYGEDRLARAMAAGR